ncbi:MAG TPA: hypothetical protein GXZ40_06045 [Bacteroidales bacterium]|nr:hypothetical protein [Bacteroidales bacterium]HPY80214.1 hypothetical protein [Bacteroidales bacterium]
MPPRYARGRSSPASPQPPAVGSQSGKKSLQARFFAAASPAAGGFTGFPATPSRSQLAHIKQLSKEVKSGKFSNYLKIFAF